MQRDPTRAQRVQIQNLKSNPGILPFKLGNAKIKTASHTFLYYIHLRPLDNQVKSIINHYQKLEKTINSSSLTHRIPLYEAYKYLGYEISVVNQKMNSLFPSRAKRGLINPMGSLIKYITGNLDEDDAKEIHQNILELENSQNNVIKKVNKQISLTNHLMQNFNNTVTTVTNNQKSIENKINEIISDLNTTEFNYVAYLEVHEVLDQIKVNLDSLLNFLTEIENAISFAALKILHRSIISPQDLRKLVDDLQNSHNLDQLLFSVSDYLKYYSVVETNVFAIEKKIVFSLDFPLVHSDLFEHYHLFSIPNQNQCTLLPPSTYLTLSKTQYEYHEEGCIYLQPNYYCKNNHLLPMHEHPDCITSLLSIKQDLDQCRLVPVHIGNTIIEEIDSAHYIGIFPKSEKIQTSCIENEILILEGTYLFVIPPNCTITTARYVFKNEKKMFHGHPVSLLDVQDAKVIPVLQVEKIKLEKTSLDKLHELQLQASQEEPIELLKSHTNYSKWSLSSVITILLAITCFLLLRFLRRRIMNNKRRVPTFAMVMVDETQVVPPLRSL